jgi:hypothetical protein
MPAVGGAVVTAITGLTAASAPIGFAVATTAINLALGVPLQYPAKALTREPSKCRP